MAAENRGILDVQIDYYRARAGEYDEWCMRLGRYDRGEEHRRRWFGEIETVEKALAALGPRKNCLELACGTGLWTRHLVRQCGRVTAVDAVPEVFELNREKTGGANVEYVQADLFDWTPERHAYDLVYFSFWLSHVPPERFEAFWAMVGSALAPGGTAFFLDNVYNPDSTARDHDQLNRDGIVERKLNSGERYRIVKIFYEPEELAAKVSVLGWDAEVRATGEFFLYGTAR